MTDTADGRVAADVLANQSYAHLLARRMVRPLLGTAVRPNHLTILRIVVGLAAAVLLGVGDRPAAIGSGVLWTLACLLDRADGELARLGDMRSESGRRLDFAADLVLDAAWFLGAGVGLRTGWLGDAAPLLGALCCVSMIVVQGVGELYDRRAESGERVWVGTRRFHLDDALFLLAVFTWCDVLAPILAISSVVLPLVAVATIVRTARQHRRGHRGGSPAT